MKTMLIKSRIALACLAVAAGTALPAHAGLFSDEEARKAILDLRAKLAAVEAQAKETAARIETKSDRSATLDMVNQNEQTLQEVAKLRGQLEVLGNDIAEAQKRQKDFYADLDARLRKIEPREVTVDGQTMQVDPNEQTAYDNGMALMRSGDYKGAAEALSNFVKRYPASNYAASAQYGLGSAYYALGDYKNAIAAQEELVTNFKTSPKAPDALWNMAVSYRFLKDAKNEKRVLTTLVADYPDSNVAGDARTRLAALK